jgi:hypothetical protein
LFWLPVFEKYDAYLINPVISYFLINIDYLLFYVPLKIYGDVNITGEGLQILDLCSALRAFERVGIFIVPHLL